MINKHIYIYTGNFLKLSCPIKTKGMSEVPILHTL